MRVVRARNPGRYEVAVRAHDLGQGACGRVYKARDPRDGRLVALKLLPAYLALDPVILERFSREARAGAKVKHPHIVSVVAAFTHEGRLYLVQPPRRRR